MKKFVDNQTKNIDLSAFRTTSTFILATSFSMIIFLLSLIRKRNLILDLGIMFLFFSVVFLFDIYISSIYYENQIINGRFESKKVFKIERKIEGISYLGLTFFYLGLLFLIFYFKLFVVIFFFTIYLWYKSTTDLKLRISVFRDIYKGYKNFKKDTNKTLTKLKQDELKNVKVIKDLGNMLNELKVGNNSEIIHLILRIVFLISIIIISIILIWFPYLILI